MAIKWFEGIRRVAMGVLLAGLSLGLVPAAQAEGCPEQLQPEYMHLHLITLDAAARRGPPEIGQAVAALQANHLPEAIALLRKVASIPLSEKAQHGRDYVYATDNAQMTAWALSGCHGIR